MLRKFLRSLFPKKWHLSTQVERNILNFCNGLVLKGPFQGMRYASTSYGSVWIPKLLGTYEIELADSLSELLKNDFDGVTVIGAAEGYYAVGLATKSNILNVTAFEPSADARQLIFEMAKLNGVELKIKVKGICDLPSLRETLSSARENLVIVDIEGGEAILLDPDIAPELQRASLIVELHEYAVPGVGELLNRRFSATHKIIEIMSRQRNISDYPIPMTRILDKLKIGAAIQKMSEGRVQGISWLVLTPK